MKTLFSLAAVGLCLSASAVTYYVSPLGSDADPGTAPEKPLKTLQRALIKTRSGDTVLLKGGIYREQTGHEWKNRNPEPVTIKAMPDETPVITFGWRVTGWKREPGGLFSAAFPYAVRDLWQRRTLDRYLKTDSMELLKKQPGAFLQDPADGRLFVNPLPDSRHNDPEDAGFTAVPFIYGKVPLPFNSRAERRFRGGMNLVGHNLRVDGLNFAFHAQEGFYMRGRQRDKFYGSGIISNCTAIGTTCGFRTGWYVDGLVYENCRAIRNCGAGIQIGSFLKNAKIRNNFLLDNGNCLPFYGNYTSTNGNVYNLSKYGGPAELVDFTGNTVLSFDGSRQGGVMRCKSGILKHTNVLNNVLGGGWPTMYSVPGSSASICNNTVLSGKFSFTISATGKEYKPDMKDNIAATNDWRKKGRFANPGKYDFRLLPDSPYKGTGAFPGVAPVWFAAPGKNGTGRTPESPLDAGKLASVVRSGDTVYFLPGSYSGKLAFKGLKDVTLSDCSCGKAKWEKAVFEFHTCENVKIDGMDFQYCRFEFSESSASFTETLLADSTFTFAGGKGVFANSRLFAAAVTSSGRLVFRENLLDGVTVKASDVISEHNGFADASQLKAWPFKETFPSFTAGERREGKVVFPVKNLVEGTAGTWIGGRPVKEPLHPLKVEDLTVTSLDSGTKAVVSWTTPEDYVRAEAVAFQNGKRVFTDQVRFGRYLSCDNAVALRNLTPGVPCRVILRLYRHNETAGWRKELDFTPVKSQPGAPRVLEAGPGKTFKTVAAALQAARSGDTILIAPGTYGEMLLVRRDNITFKAAKPGTVRLSAEFMFDYIIRAEDVKGLTIENLDFVGLRYSSAVAAVYLQRAEKVRMKNCRFLAVPPRRMGNNHVQGRFVRDVEITNCVFDYGFQGIWFMESAGSIKVDHCTFWGCGVNAIHLTGGPGCTLTVTNNLFQDVVSNHINPSVSVGDPKSRLVCDWNLYWHTKERCPGQKIFGMGGVLGVISLGQVLHKDACVTIEEARKRYNVEKNGLWADPKLKSPAAGDFTLLPGSAAAKRGSDGRDIGADLTVFAGK